jgi:hypothetical protein
LAFLLGAALATEHAAASTCGRVYPGALQGPPPEWTFWADGSACYVRWQSSDVPEERLFEKCRRTPGARFIHFEKDHGAGSICVFKVLASSDEPASSDPAGRREPAEALQSTHYRKADAETPVLEDLENLVTNWTERCLQREKAEAQKAAARCWRDGASALGDFAGAREHVLPQQFVVHVKELQDAWGKRSAQLEATPVAVAVAVENESPPQTTDFSRFAHDGPDPQRLAATAHCSSTRLGDMKRCLRQPRSAGSELYTFGLKSSCSSGVIAAVKTYDSSGRCIRKVIWIKRGEASSQPIRSMAQPDVIDAISYKNRAVLECYARRHDEISCDGRTDYGAGGTATAEQHPPVAANKVLRVKRNYRLRYEQAEQEQVDQPIRYRRKQRGVLDSLSSKIRSLVGSD